MSAKLLPKTLAKNLAYIACHAPGEFGLFWNPDGTMPWKEFYWALQEDTLLRFVRQKHISELHYLGISIPFEVNGSQLKLRQGVPIPKYDLIQEVPARLYYGSPRKRVSFIKKAGLMTSSRPFLPLFSSGEMALRIGRRRDPEPVLIEVLAKEAGKCGIIFRWAGSELYLAERIPVDHLVFPVLKEEEPRKVAGKSKRKKLDKASADTPVAVSPGSFYPGAQQLYKDGTEKARKRKSDWKKEAGRRRGRSKRRP